MSVVLVVSIVVAMMVVVQRIQYDQSNKTVALAMSWQDVTQWSSITGVDRQIILRRLQKEAGLTTLLLEESTLKELVEKGKVTLLKGADILNMLRVGGVYRYILTTIIKKNNIHPDYYYVFVDETALYQRVKRYLESELGVFNVTSLGYSALELKGDYKHVLSVGLGISVDEVDALHAMGYDVVPYLKNSQFLSANTIKMKIDDLAEPVNMVLFDRKEVVGYPHKVNWVAQVLKKKAIRIGNIEFSNQAGSQLLAKQLPGQVIRVHNIDRVLFDTMDEALVTRRYVRAVKERNVRLLLLKPYYTPTVQQTIHARNYNFVAHIRSQLVDSGYHIAQLPPSDFLHQSIPNWLFFVIGLGVMVVSLWVMQLFFQLSTMAIAMASIFVMSSYYAVQWMGGMMVWRQGVALIAAIVFPVYALITQFPSQVRSSELSYRIFFGLIFIFKCVGISFIGAIMIQALLYDPWYLLNIDHFYGVKLAIIIPLGLIAFYFYVQPHRMTSFFYVIRRLVFVPVNMVVLTGLIFTVCFISFYLLRSGNYISFTMPVLESWLRTVLETTLFIRPRTKEFLIGYPFLLMAYVFFGTVISKKWLWFFLSIGCVALISLINSFCHFHTPFLISSYRSVLGMMLGIGIGLCCIGSVLICQWRLKH